MHGCPGKAHREGGGVTPYHRLLIGFGFYAGGIAPDGCEEAEQEGKTKGAKRKRAQNG